MVLGNSRPVTFPHDKSPRYRYYYDRSVFCYPDAIFLYCFLRHIQPARIIEVGSGFSSDVMLDTVERFFPTRPRMTFIEPYPDRLNQIRRDADRDRVAVIADKVQNASADLFTTLQAGDLLFIDSSHVVKCGSDVQFLLFECAASIGGGRLRALLRRPLLVRVP